MNDNQSDVLVIYKEIITSESDEKWNGKFISASHTRLCGISFLINLIKNKTKQNKTKKQTTKKHQFSLTSSGKYSHET